jgi:hypothetical protein
MERQGRALCQPCAHECPCRFRRAHLRKRRRQQAPGGTGGIGEGVGGALGWRANMPRAWHEAASRRGSMLAQGQAGEGTWHGRVPTAEAGQNQHACKDKTSRFANEGGLIFDHTQELALCMARRARHAPRRSVGSTPVASATQEAGERGCAAKSARGADAACPARGMPSVVAILARCMQGAAREAEDADGAKQVSRVTSRQCASRRARKQVIKVLSVCSAINTRPRRDPFAPLSEQGCPSQPRTQAPHVSCHPRTPRSSKRMAHSAPSNAHSAPSNAHSAPRDPHSAPCNTSGPRDVTSWCASALPTPP